MNLIEKIMSWFGGKVVPLEEAQKQMPNHEPEEKEPTTTDEGYEKIVEKKKPKKPRKPRTKKQPDSPKTNQNKKPRKPRKPRQPKGENK